MGKKVPIIYNALLLTGANLLLRFVSTSFQVYLSGRIGAEGIGLLQLILSVGALSMTIGMGGIRTATMYLCAEVVGQKREDSIFWVLSGCIAYSVILSSFVGILVYRFSPQIADAWIGDIRTTGIVRLVAGYIPVNCLCGVMIGYFTGVNKISTLVSVEVAEQMLSMVFTVLLIATWADNHIYKACMSVVAGSGLGACFTLVTLLIIKHKYHDTVGHKINVRKKLLDTALPLAIADDIKVGITTTENLMVPKRLALYQMERNPMGAFGSVCGMVFPVLMFPAAILFGLAELLIPELARCNAAGSKVRIHHLSEKSLSAALLYGCLCGGILYISADSLCSKLYSAPEAGKYLQWYACLAPMLYCDAIIDAITKGLGQQKICVRNNIITSALDVILLFILLPKYGMTGYFLSFLITHLINFILSSRILYKLIGQTVKMGTAIYSILFAVTGILISKTINNAVLSCILFTIIYISQLTFSGRIKNADFQWIKGMITK